MEDAFDRWDDEVDELSARSSVPAAQACAALLASARDQWGEALVAHTSMHDLVFTGPGDDYPWRAHVRVSWRDGVFDFRLLRGSLLVTADKTNKKTSRAVLDAFLFQLVAEGPLNIPGEPDPCLPKALLIGLWLGEHAPGWPDVRAFVDPASSKVGRVQIADRLDSGRRTDRAYMGYSRCRICGCQNGSGELTDGMFIWPEGLGHYVRHHDVRLPEEIERELRHPATAPDAVLDRVVRASNDERDVAWWKDISSGGSQ